MRDDEHAHPLAEQFRHFAADAERTSPVYGLIARSVADDPELLALTATAPPAQRRPNLLLAAVHDLLLSGVDHPLAEYYPTVLKWRGVAPPGSAGRPPTPAGVVGAGADVARRFHAFCLEHRDRVATVLAARATQTNEIGRCALLLPALATVGAGSDRPLGLVDLGASAGLNLLFDRYAYRYHPGGAAGRSGSPVVIDCEVRAGRLPAPEAPVIARRLGLDERPLEPADPDDARWLLACQWPDELERFRRLQAALAIAASDGDRPEVRRGDVVDDLAALAADVPGTTHLCLVHTWVAAYLTPARQRELAEAVAEVARTRAVSWLFAELPFEVPGLPVPPAPGGDGIPGATAVVLVDHQGDEPRARRLADAHPHGRWVRWYG